MANTKGLDGVRTTSMPCCPWSCSVESLSKTAPHHAAKLSHLQSVLPKADRKIIAEINKFVREIYGQRDLGLNIYDLQAQDPDDLVAVAWSDAALAKPGRPLQYRRHADRLCPSPKWSRKDNVAM